MLSAHVYHKTSHDIQACMYIQKDFHNIHFDILVGKYIDCNPDRTILQNIDMYLELYSFLFHMDREDRIPELCNTFPDLTSLVNI